MFKRKINRNKILGFILVLFAGCHSKQDSHKYYVYANEELSSEFIFLLEKDTLKYTERLDTFSDNIEQKDIVYNIVPKQEILSKIQVIYNQRFKTNCDEKEILEGFQLLLESLKDFHKGCIPSEIKELTFSGQKFLFAHCGSNAVLETCVNNHFVRIYFYECNISSIEDIKKIFRYRSW